MSTTFPTSLQDLDATRGTTGQPLSTPNHITHHQTEDDTIEALEAKVGVNGSAVTTSHDYKLSGVTGSDKAASKTGSETLTNKTLTAPVISSIVNTGTLTLPSSTDTLVGKATTDILTNKTISGANNTLTVREADLSTTDVTTANATTSKHGFLKKLSNVVTEFMDGTGNWSVPSNPTVYKNGTTNHDITSTTTQNIAHGLGTTPRYIRITSRHAQGSGISSSSDGVYNGTTNACAWQLFLGAGSSTNGEVAAVFHIGTSGSAYLEATATFDATNIILTFSKTGSPSGTASMLWEAFA